MRFSRFLQEEKIKELDKKYPSARKNMNGYIVDKEIPNLSSIESTLENYKILNGVREVSIKEFDSDPHDIFYAKNDIERVEQLAQEIKTNKKIKPLIVVMDNQGLYVLEGAHRLGALHVLKFENIPALIVIDLDEIEFDLSEIYKKEKIEEAEYKGKKVKLHKPFRTPKGPKKFSVYVKNDKGNVVKVNFGDPDMEIKRDDSDRRKAFRSRHGCDKNPGPKWKAKYWSCRFWEKGKSVSDLTK
jgi:disulfide oxidoreductase YuzD